MVSKRRIAVPIFFLLVVVLSLLQHYSISFIDLSYVIKKEVLGVSLLTDEKNIPSSRKCGGEDEVPGEKGLMRLPDVALPPFCAVQYTDQLLASRCRDARLELPVRKEGDDDETRLEKARTAFRSMPSRGEGNGMVKYDNRDCDSGLGLWRDNWLSGGFHKHKCVLVTVAERLDLRPKEIVLDWGSGCGFKLSWLAQLYGTSNFGVDIAPAPVAWAQEHSSGQHGCTDASKLSWIPAETFDAVISYGSLMHLPEELQCSVVHEMLRVLRPLGRIYIGWFNNPSIGVSVGTAVDPDFWAGNCLKKDVLAGSVRVSIHNEAHLFAVELDAGMVVGGSTEAYGLFVWKGSGRTS